MITHYLKVAFRNLLKYKTQTVISILGLAVGFTCFALSAIWIHYEMTYDTFHEDAGQIQFVRQSDEMSTRENKLVNATPYVLARHLKDNFAEVKAAWADNSNVDIVVDNWYLTYYGDVAVDLSNVQVLAGLKIEY